jgi:uncharacterized protein YvpB
MHLATLVAPAILIGMLAGCTTSRPTEERISFTSPCFVAVTNFGRFWETVDTGRGETVFTSSAMRTPVSWDELVVSWNATAPHGTAFKFEARPLYPDRKPEFYTLGYWAEDTAEQRRESVTGQKNQLGDVETDILVLKQPSDRVQLRVTVLGATQGEKPALKFLGLSFLNTKTSAPALPPNRAAWGKSLPVPERSQLSHSGGRDWCSPTSVSMVLAYWSARLNRRELDVEVPEVAAGVFDKNWPGTGNWPFNTAFAGKFPRMRGYVTRLADVSELEILVNAGIPPIVSVSFDWLHGKAEDPGAGHLVVCVGFNEHGDAIINDPWAALDKGEKVRQVVSRANLAKAWSRSRQTVYLIYPEEWRVPKSPNGRW